MNRCLCGLATRHHFEKRDGVKLKLDCWQAAARHQRASIRRTKFADLLKSCAPFADLPETPRNTKALLAWRRS